MLHSMVRCLVPSCLEWTLDLTWRCVTGSTQMTWTASQTTMTMSTNSEFFLRVFSDTSN